MKIEDVITEAEYNRMSKLTYSQFCDYLMRISKFCVEEALKAIPHVITHLSKQSIYLKTLSDNFYKDNKDLDNNRELVTKVMEKVESENPGISYEEVLKKSATIAREQLSNMKLVTNNDPLDLEIFDDNLGKL